MSRYLEDIPLGETVPLGSYAFTAEEIKTFARAFDPQPFHVDEAAARASHFGALCASGWHTAAVWMKLMLQHARKVAEEQAARGEPVARMGPSPGFRDMKWLKPVFAGDTIAYTTAMIGTRPSASRPGWGLATHRNTGTNQHGERVFEFTGTVFIERRPG